MAGLGPAMFGGGRGWAAGSRGREGGGGPPNHIEPTLAQSCGNQSAEREEAGKSRCKELLVIHDVNEVVNDDDALELLKATLSSSSSMQDDRGTGGDELWMNFVDPPGRPATRRPT